MNLYEAFAQGRERGEARRTKRTLAEFVQPALGGDQQALGQIYSVDPDIGYKVQGMARQQREQDYGDLVRVAQYYQQTGDPNAYGVLREQAARLGPQFAGLPATIDTDEDRAGSMKFAAALVDNFGPEPNAQVREFRSMSQTAGLSPDEQARAARIELGLDPRAVSSGMQVKQGQDGNWYAVNPAQGSATPIMVGGQQQPQALQFTAQDGTPASIDPSLPQHVQQSIMQNEGQWAQAPHGATAQLPPATVGTPFAAPQRPQRAPAAPRAAAQQRAPSGYQFRPDGTLEPIPGGPADRPQAAQQPKAAAPKPLTSEAATKAALLDNATRAANNWYAMVVNPDGSYNDIAANSPAARSLLNQALRAKLRAESGATITEEEIAGEFNRYFGGLSSAITSDKTMAQRAQALLDDLKTQRGAFGGAAPQQPPQEPPRQPPTAPPPRRPVLPSQAAQPESDDDLINKYRSP